MDGQEPRTLHGAERDSNALDTRVHVLDLWKWRMEEVRMEVRDKCAVQSKNDRERRRGSGGWIF